MKVGYVVELFIISLKSIEIIISKMKSHMRATWAAVSHSSISTDMCLGQAICHAHRMVDTEVIRCTAKDFAPPRTKNVFTGHVAQPGPYQSGTYLRCVNVGAPIPCTEEKFSAANPKLRYAFTILGIAKVSTSSAPFTKKGKDGKSTRDKSAKNLAEAVGPDGVKIYAFSKVKSNMDKGPRDEEMHFTLRVGQTITMCLRDFMFSGERDVFGNDKGYTEIPPFAVMDVVVSPTNNEDPR